MNPSPYLLRFSGLASQKWTCPSTTKYFSPSFSYKALSSFSRTNDTPPSSSRTYHPILRSPSQERPLSSIRETAQPSPIKGLVTPVCYYLLPRLEAGPARFRPFVALMISDPGSRGKRDPIFPDRLNKVSRSR